MYQTLNTTFEQSNHNGITNLDLLPGDIAEILSGPYAGKQVRFLGYWYPGCRVELLESSEIVDVLLDRAVFVKHGSTNVSEKVVNLVYTVEISEENILEIMCGSKLSREEAIKQLTKVQLLASIDDLVEQAL
jgi:hypothetical protein